MHATSYALNNHIHTDTAALYSMSVCARTYSPTGGIDFSAGPAGRGTRVHGPTNAMQAARVPTSAASGGFWISGTNFVTKIIIVY